MSVNVDMMNMELRDPLSINDHLQVNFEDIIGEPDGTHSPDWSWKAANWCFNGGKNTIYKIMAVFCNCFLGLCWGCSFGCVTFCHIWNCTPWLRFFAINCGWCQKCWGTFNNCFCAPICESCGLCLTEA